MRRALPGLLLSLWPAVAPAAPPPPGPVTQVGGTVVDAAGNPVAGAEVGTVTGDGPLYLTRTAADGTFSLPTETRFGRPAFPHVIARGPGGELGVGAEFAGAADFPATVRLAPPHALTVTVIAADGAPAAGAAVYALAAYQPVAVGVIGPDGTAVLALPAGAPLMQTVALKPGAGFGYVWRDRDGSGPTPDRVSVRLSPPAVHRVTVLAADPAGGAARPLPGARATVWFAQTPGQPEAANLSNHGGRWASAVAGPDGAAVLDWLPADATGPVRFNVSADGYEDAEAFVPTGDPGEADRPGFNANATAAAQTVTLEPTATFAGRVTLPDGSPAAGVMVRAEGQNWDLDTYDYERNLTFTGPDGRWELEVRGRASYLVVPLPGSPSVYEESEPAGGLAAAALGREEPVVVAPGGRRGELDFTLTEGTRVTGAVTRDGEPVPDYTVGLNTQGALAPADAGANVRGDRLGLPRWTKTDAEGRYAFRVGPGEHRLTPFGGEVGGGTRVDAGERPTTVTRDVVLKPEPEPVAVAGTVTDEYGLPLAGVVVTVADDRRDAVRGVRAATVTTDADGAFRLARTPRYDRRDWFLLATGFDATRGQVTGFQDIDVTAGDATDLRVTVSRSATVTGRVTGGGDPIAGLPLSLRATGSLGFPDGAPFAFPAVTGPAGRVVFRGPVDGVRYYVDAGERLGWEAVGPRVVPNVDAVDAGTLAFYRPDLSAATPDDRRRWAFAPPADRAAAVKDLRADAAALGRHALLLVADPDSAAGRDLFAAVYDDPALAAAADAGFLTRCLPAPDADGAATLTALAPDGATLGTLTHAAGDRDALAAFLAAHRPAAD